MNYYEEVLSRYGIELPDFEQIIGSIMPGIDRLEAQRFDIECSQSGGMIATLEVSCGDTSAKVVHRPGYGWRLESIWPEAAPSRTRYFSPSFNHPVASAMVAQATDKLDAARAREAIGLAEVAFMGAAQQPCEAPSSAPIMADLIEQNRRLREVIEAADDWRQALNLPQQDIGCEEFVDAWTAYDTVRHGINDLVEPREESDDP
jgi:hypothetical protein